jgi:pimeloyl-ACP methyl ester carboxylesterase
MTREADSGYAPVDEVDVYWESRGAGGTPLLLVHGGYGLTSIFDDVAAQWARDRQVIAIELEGHGHTRATGRPFSWEGFGDEVAGVIKDLGTGPVDLLGYSLGGGASLRCAIQHPSMVRRLILISAPHRRDGWFPEVLAGFDGMSSALFPQFQMSPMYQAWRAVAPDPGSFPALMDATGDLLRMPYDWSAEVRKLPMPVLLAFADADGISPARAAEFFALLGGGQQDASWDGSQRGTASRLAILPGQTHYDMLSAPGLTAIVAAFTA